MERGGGGTAFERKVIRQDLEGRKQGEGGCGYRVQRCTEFGTQFYQAGNGKEEKDGKWETGTGLRATTFEAQSRQAGITELHDLSGKKRHRGKGQWAQVRW